MAILERDAKRAQQSLAAGGIPSAQGDLSPPTLLLPERTMTMTLHESLDLDSTMDDLFGASPIIDASSLLGSVDPALSLPMISNGVTENGVEFNPLPVPVFSPTSTLSSLSSAEGMMTLTQAQSGPLDFQLPLPLAYGSTSQPDPAMGGEEVTGVTMAMGMAFDGSSHLGYDAIAMADLMNSLGQAS